MSKRANPVVIGGFVLGALVLGIGGLTAFGSGLFSREAKEVAIARFDGSVSGLAVGAPVTFRGVRIGQVKSIQLQLIPDTFQARIPVELEIDTDKVAFVGAARSLSESLNEAIDKGLRAQLQVQSFVTGLVSVNLDFFPAAPPPDKAAGQAMEIPTLRSSFDSLLESVGSLPLQDLAGTALAVLSNLNDLLSSPEIKILLTSGARGAEALEQAATTAKSAIGPLSQSLELTLAEARTTLQTIQQATKATQTDVSGLMGDSRKLAQDADKQLLALSAQANATLKATEQAVQAANSLIGPASAQRADLEQVLRNLNYVTRSLRGFAEQLERNPNALIVGKR
ncbi:MAG: MlaD family protein [Elstera sp.]